MTGNTLPTGKKTGMGLSGKSNQHRIEGFGSRSSFLFLYIDKSEAAGRRPQTDLDIKTERPQAAG